MNRLAHRWKCLVLIACSSPLLMGGCECNGKKPGTAGSAAKPAVIPVAPATPSEPLIKKVEIADWCPEHGVPESICTRCNSALIPAFKSKGDWCEKHGLPESQCLTCHPELKDKLEAMKPKA